MKPLYIFRGKVKEGMRRGRELGYPTANIALHKQIPEGIYAAEVTIAGKTHQAATFIGPSVTFGEKEYKAESYILDFHENIYDKYITVRLFKKIRENKKFASIEKLIQEMENDVAGIRKFFKKNL